MIPAATVAALEAPEYILARELQDRCARAGLQPEWDGLVRDLDRPRAHS